MVGRWTGGSGRADLREMMGESLEERAGRGTLLLVRREREDAADPFPVGGCGGGDPPRLLQHFAAEEPPGLPPRRGLHQSVHAREGGVPLAEVAFQREGAELEGNAGAESNKAFFQAGDRLPGRGGSRAGQPVRGLEEVVRLGPREQAPCASCGPGSLSVPARQMKGSSQEKPRRSEFRMALQERGEVLEREVAPLQVEVELSAREDRRGHRGLPLERRLVVTERPLPFVQQAVELAALEMELGAGRDPQIPADGIDLSARRFMARGRSDEEQEEAESQEAHSGLRSGRRLGRLLRGRYVVEVGVGR